MCMNSPKHNNFSGRPVQSRPVERNFSRAVLVENESRYIRVTNQIEEMLVQTKK